ncbi:HAD family hydrolase [Priestia megaterium]|uniref:HAD family hydrolase n=1 Tax=Priestia megaterium TaxID=1404 RepID=UPI003AB58016
MIKVVVFDFDGLIIDTESVWYEVYREMLEDRGVDLPIATFASYVGTDATALYDYLLQQFNNEFTKEELAQESLRRHQEKMKSLVAREGVAEYLAEAKELGLKIGLASSSYRDWVTAFLKELDLLHYFEVIQTRDDVEKVKPDPALYRNAIEKLGVEPSEALAFEDSSNGAKAAMAAGLRCVIVPNPLTKHLSFERYHLHIESMKEKSLKEVIQYLCIED